MTFIFIIQFLADIGNVSAKPSAPNLTVSKVSSSGATIALLSDYKNASVLYSVFYREVVQNDDEKEQEWMEKTLEKDSNSIVIDSLQPATNFEVRSRYQVIETSILSDFSKLKTFTTSKVQFEWDAERKRSDLSLSNNGKTFTMPGSDGWRAVYAKQKISRKTMKQCRFEITLRYFTTSNLFFVTIFNTTSYNERCTERR